MTALQVFFSFSEAEAPKVEAGRGLCDCFVMQIDAKYSSNEGGSEVIELVEKLLAEVTSMCSEQMCHFGRAGAQSAEEQFDAGILNVCEVFSESLQLAKSRCESVVAVLLRANNCAEDFDGAVRLQDSTSVADLIGDPILLLYFVKDRNGNGRADESNGGLDIMSRAT